MPKPKDRWMSRPRPIDDKTVWIVDLTRVAVARDVPQNHPVAALNLLTMQVVVGRGGAGHVCQRRLPANDL